jgi:predicted acetyltransferase
MFLTPPDPRYAESFQRYVDDYRRAGEASRVSKYAAGERDFPAYVESLHLAARGIDLPADRVPYHTFWLIDAGEIVGIIRVRPRLTPEVEKNDGHIGYDVAPSCRRKGYGTTLLQMVLIEARRLGLGRVIVTCATSNVPSRRVIEKCGGRLLGETIDDDDGHLLYRYELATPELIPSLDSVPERSTFSA